jgi:hypothetical protein
MAQVVEHLPSKCEALSSKSTTAKKKKTWKKKAMFLLGCPTLTSVPI